MSRIKLATQEERAAHEGVYPLHGFITISGIRCAVEDLRVWDRGDPQWELVLPAAHHLEVEGLHTLLGFTQADLLDRVKGDSVVHCEPGCDCGWDYPEE